MAKPLSSFICQDCGTAHSKWTGQCTGCGEWNRLVEEVAEARPKSLQMKKGKGIEVVSLAQGAEDVPRLQVGISELDRVLGGGLVAGSAILIGGDPGIGKSTLLLQAVAALAGRGAECLYISGEESIHQISLRAHRLGVANPKLKLSASASVKDILTTLDTNEAPDVVIIDSIQTMFLDTLDAAPGTVSQVRAAGHELVRLAKKRGFALFLVGHVTKDGQIAGPRVLEHMVDTVLYFEGERGNQCRILRGIKNRFGGTDEIGVFEMAEAGLREITNPSSLFLSQRDQPVSGSVVFAGMEGSRPLLVEIQALVAPSVMSMPRRAVVGWDSGRLSMLLAVLEARCGVNLANKEVYLNVTGGFRITEPAADLAVAAAILSAFSDIPLPDNGIVFGEVGLSGEIRQVGHAERRLKEAQKLGFVQAMCPPQSKGGKNVLPMQEIHHLQEVAHRLMKTDDSTRRERYGS
jgi:DNA repair protein RadA/Sms